MNDIYDIHPLKFYLLSVRNYRLFDFSTSEHILEKAVENAFNCMKRIEGGNIYAVYQYEECILSVMNELADKYKAQYPQVQQLFAYFKQCKEGEYIIRQSIFVPLLNLKSSIVKVFALEHGLDAHKVHEVFITNWARLSLNFEAYSYGFLPNKIFIGEKDKAKRICRFCMKSGITRFKNDSHAIQEGLGNHLLIANEECDECNTLFSNSVERHLFRFLETNRTLSQVRGKGKSTYHQEGLNFHIHPDTVTGLPTVYVKQEYIENELYNGQTTGRILLYNNGPITYQGVYKALVKIAVDMIPQDKIAYFAQTGMWVHGDFEADNLPSFWYGEHSFFFEQPVLDLFFKKDNTHYNAPYCTAVLYIYESVFIYVVPLNEIDVDKNFTKEKLLSHMDFFKKYEYLYVKEWAEYDSNDTKEYAAHYKISPLGVEGKYHVKYRPSDDPIFEIRRNK